MISKIKTIAYKLKELGKRECKHESLQWFDTSLPTSTLLNLRVPLSWSFNQASNLFTIGLWFQFTLLDFWLPSTLYNSQEISHSWNFLSRFTNDWSHKILVLALSSNDTRKTKIEWCTKDMQVMKQWCTQKHSSKAQIYSRMIWEG